MKGSSIYQRRPKQPIQHPQNRLAREILTNYKPSQPGSRDVSLKSSKSIVSGHGNQVRNLNLPTLRTDSSPLSIGQELQSRFHNHAGVVRHLRGSTHYTPRLNMDVAHKESEQEPQVSHRQTLSKKDADRVNSVHKQPIEKKTFQRYPGGFPNTKSSGISQPSNHVYNNNSTYSGHVEHRLMKSENSSFQPAENKYSRSQITPSQTSKSGQLSSKQYLIETGKHEGFQSFRQSSQYQNTHSDFSKGTGISKSSHRRLLELKVSPQPTM